ncbi:MAG TPA: hypothetical protein DCF33_22735 [Saprospirales bacterium]|nr:hypothetical protein [Saprospirales bacterium]
MHYACCLAAALSLSCTAQVSVAQPAASTFIDRSLLLEELTWVQNKLHEVHPEPYHFISQKEFEERMERVKSNLKPMTKELWYVELAGLIAALHDGHTALYYPNEDRAQYFKQGGKVFPFWIYLDDDQRVIVQSQFLQDARLDSTVILEINQKPIDEVIDNMRLMTFGESDLFRYRQISYRFNRMYWLLYGHTDSVLLKTRLANGDIYEKHAACLESAQYDSLIRILFPVSPVPKRAHLDFTYLKDRSVGLLTLHDFSTYKGYRDSIKTVFRQIQEHRIDTLFLDLRDNGGGEHSVTEEINHYLLKTPWVLVSKAKVKMSPAFYGAFPKALRAFRFLPKKPILKLAAAVMTKNTKIQKITVERDSVSREPIYEIYTRPRQHYSKKHFYEGVVYLLTNRNSYSMSGMFAAIMKDYQRAIIVGEETGGLANPHGSNVALTLPHSKFQFTVSTSRAYRPSGVFDHLGVQPDIPVSYSELKDAESIEELLKLVHEPR